MNVATVLLCKKCGKSRSGPTFLPCSHTVCKQCLQSDAKSSHLTSITYCPVCEREIQKAGDIDILYQHLNTCLTAVSDVLGKRLFEDEVTTCCICRLQNVTSQTTHQCLDCGDTLCEVCQKGHQSSSATHAHRTVEIGEIRTGKYKVKSPTSFPCHQHGGKKYEFYCATCSTPLCAMCLVFRHMGLSHQVISLDEATVRCRSRLQDITGKTEEKLKEQNSLIRNILTLHRQTVDKTQETTIATVRQKTQALIDQILKEEHLIVEEIRKLCDHQRTDLDLQENMLTQVLQTGVKGVQLSKGVLEDGTAEEIILVFEDMVKMLDSSNISVSSDDCARYVAGFRSPVYTVEYNFPVSQSPLFTLRENFLEPPIGATASMKPIPVSTSDTDEATAVPKDTYSMRKDTSRPWLSGANGSQCTEEMFGGPTQASLLCIRQDICERVNTESERENTDIVSESLARRLDSVEDTDNYDSLLETESLLSGTDNIAEEGVFKVTESLSIVGDLGRSLSLNESTTSEENPPDDVSLQDGSVSSTSDPLSTSDVFPDVIPGPYDCNVVPPRTFPSRFSVTGLGGTKSKSSVNSNSQKNNAMCLVKKGTFSTLVTKDTVNPNIVGSCGVSGNKLVILDNGNKKVRLIHESGTHGNVNRPNKLKDSLSLHGVASCGCTIVYICGTTVYISGGSLNLVRKFSLDLTDITGEVSVSLPLCAYTENSFLVGNLPGNKYRVYNVDGKKLDERQFQVDGLVVSVSRTKDDDFLCSSWNQPGAVYQVRKSGQKVQTYRPPGNHVWYPEDSCVDTRRNVFVANPRQCQIHVFDARGSQIFLQSIANLASPRCLTMTPDNTLIVSGDGAILQTYRCTYYTKT